MISVRLHDAEISSLKAIANRLGAQDSNVIRYALQALLSRLAPLANREMQGTELLPLLIDHGPELAREFHVSLDQLEEIVNDKNIDPRRAVDREDLALLLMSDLPSDYVQVRLNQLAARHLSGRVSNPDLKEYLYRKYRLLGESPTHEEKKSPDKRVPAWVGY